MTATVLLARFLAWGDVLLTLPLLRTLHASRAVSGVDVVTLAPYADLLRRSPYVRNLVLVDPETFTVTGDLSGAGYDLLVDLHTRAAPLPPAVEDLLASVRAGRRVSYAGPLQAPGEAAAARPGWTVLETRRWDEHAVEYYARSVADLIDGPIASGVVDIDPADVEAAAASVPPGAVCVAPGARYAFKRWPEERYVDLVRSLADDGVPSVLIGHSFDAAVIGRVRAATGAPALIIDDDYRRAAVLRAAGVAVTNNSGMTHLAQVAGARVVCVHSHTLPAMWRPWGDGHANLVGEPGACSCPGLTRFELPAPCGKQIPVEAVAAAVAGLRLDGGVRR